MMSPINGYIIISLILTLGYFLSLLTLINDKDEGKCEMTYMFEYPQFVRISNRIDQKYPKYGLYAYSEGSLTERARNMQFDGIPILFIPGSMGSHKQVRSLASIALRKALNSRTSYHFNYFTVDLNNEMSAFNGALLNDQLDYVNHSIYRVLELYDKRRNPPKSVVLVGHSMGGIIAKSIISKLPDDSTLIPIVIALSAPLKRPVLSLDYFFDKFYVDAAMNFTASSKSTFVSIAGGYNDLLVPTYLTKDGHLNLVATCTPKSWVSTDHVQIIWCKQLVLALNRALFESVDLQTKQISMDHDNRLAIFNHHLVKHSGTNILLRSEFQSPVTFSKQGEWFESIYRQYSVRLPKGTRESRYYMVPIAMLEKHEILTVVILNMEAPYWVFVCPASIVQGSRRICETGNHLTQHSEISPSALYKRRTLRINMHQLKRNFMTHSHVIIRVMPTNEPVVVHIDVHSSKERTVTVATPPKWYSFNKQVVIEETEEKEIDYEIVLPHFTQIIQSYTLHLEPIICTDHGHHATVSLIVPWDHYDWHGFVTDSEKKPLKLRLYSSKPTSWSNSSASVRLTLDPTCRYKVSIQSSYHFGNMARFYSPLLIANVAAVLLMTLRAQLKNISENEKCSLFFTALKAGAKPYYVVTAVKILSKFLSANAVLKVLPLPDWQILADESMDFLLLPLLLYVISVGLVWIIGIVLSIMFICFESSIHKLVLKLLSKTFVGTSSWHENAINAFHKVPGVLAILLLAMSFSTSGGLAICIATLFYFLKLTQMAQNFIEDLVKRVVKTIGNKLKEKVVKKIKEKWRKRKGGEDINAMAIESNKQLLENENNSNKMKEIVDGGNFKTNGKIDGDEDVASISSENVNSNLTKRQIGEGLVQTKEMLEVQQDSETNVSTVTNTSILNEIDLSWIREITENNEIFFHFTIFCLYLFIACLNIPSVLTWAHNFKYSRHLEPDPAFIPGIILSSCAIPLWQLEFPRVDRLFYLEMSHLMYGVAVISLIYGMVSMYRLSFILSSAVALITIHQLFALRKLNVVVQNVEENNEDENEEDSYEKKVKVKLE